MKITNITNSTHDARGRRGLGSFLQASSKGNAISSLLMLLSIYSFIYTSFLHKCLVTEAGYLACLTSPIYPIPYIFGQCSSVVN